MKLNMKNSDSISTLYLLFKKAEDALDKKLQCFFGASNADLNLEQWLVIDLLYHKGSMTQQTLANLLHKDKAYVTRTIDFLEARQYIKRIPCKKDRRNKYVRLTPEGKLFYGNHRHVNQEMVIAIHETFTTGEIQIFAEGLRSFKKGITELEKN